MNKFSKKIIFGLLGALAVFLMFGYFLGKTERVPVVAETFPKTDEEQVLVTQDIIINFDRELTQTQKDNLTFEFNPKGEYAQIWKTNGVEIAPVGGMVPSAIYDVFVKYKDEEIYKFSFQTASLSVEKIEEEGGLQSQDDLDFSNAFNTFLEKYPWYPSLPIETSEFTIFYDFQRNSFRIRLKEGVDKTTGIEKALDALEAIGVEGPIPYYTP